MNIFYTCDTYIQAKARIVPILAIRISCVQVHVRSPRVVPRDIEPSDMVSHDIEPRDIEYPACDMTYACDIERAQYRVARHPTARDARYAGPTKPCAAPLGWTLGVLPSKALTGGCSNGITFLESV